MKNIIIVIVVLVLVGGGIWFLLRQTSEEPIILEEEITEEVEDELLVVTIKLPAEITSYSGFQKWLEGQHHKVTGSILDNFARKEERSFGYYGEFTNEQLERLTRLPDEAGEGAILTTYSPDKSKLLIIHASPPDTGVYLLDLENQQIANIGYCGTVCTFDYAFWLNDSKLVVTQISFLEPGDDPGLWEASLECQKSFGESFSTGSCLVFSVKAVNLEDNSRLDYYTLYLSRSQ